MTEYTPRGVTATYTTYLLEFIDICKEHHKVSSIPALGKIAGSDSFPQTVNWWKTRTLKRTVTDETYKLLANIDPKKRTVAQLKQYFEHREVNDLKAEIELLKSELKRNKS